MSFRKPKLFDCFVESLFPQVLHRANSPQNLIYNLIRNKNNYKVLTKRKDVIV